MVNPFRISEALSLALLVCSAAATGQSDNFLGHREPIDPAESRVVMLGTTGGPIPRVDRSQPASLLIVRGKAFLVDTGDGAARQLVRAGYALNQVEAVFLTHLHFDHTAGLGSFMAFDWMSRRAKPVTIFGPPGTEELVSSNIAAYAISENIFRPQPSSSPSMRAIFRSKSVDTSAPSKIYDDGEIRVFAVENSHYSTKAVAERAYGHDRSYSYRFELPDRTIVFTGDTGPSSALEKFAEGADILISEVIDTKTVVKALRDNASADSTDLDRGIAHMEREHLAAEEVGRLASAAKVKMVVLTHLVGAVRMNTDPLVRGVRQYFKGPVVAAQDLDAF